MILYLFSEFITLILQEKCDKEIIATDFDEKIVTNNQEYIFFQNLDDFIISTLF